MRATVLLLFTVAVVFSTTSVQSQEHRIQTNTAFGCTDKAYFQKLVSYSVQNDEAAFKKALLAGIITGQCAIFKRGEIVYLSDVTIFSGLVQIRQKVTPASIGQIPRL